MGWRVLRGQAGKKGVVTFNRPALTGQGPDREVRGDRNGPGRTWVGQTHTKALSEQWSGLSPNKSLLWLNSLKDTWNMTPGLCWHHHNYNTDLGGKKTKIPIERHVYPDCKPFKTVKFDKTVEHQLTDSGVNMYIVFESLLWFSTNAGRLHQSCGTLAESRNTTGRQRHKHELRTQ